MSDLTDEQRKRIEENRRRALEKKATRLSNPIALQVQKVPTSSFYSEKPQLPASVAGQPTTRVCVNSQNSSFPGQTTPSSLASSHKNSPKVKKLRTSELKPSTNSNESFKTQLRNTVNANIIPGFCRLSSEDRFIVDIGYHQVMIEIFKKIRSSKYDAQERKWSFLLEDHNELMKALQDIRGEVSVSRLPKLIIETFSTPPSPPVDVDLSRIDPKLVDNLMPFQREGVCFGISKHGRCMIADDMGLGKTIQALGIAHYYQADWPLLIVCPSSMKIPWEEAIQTWLPTVPLHHIQAMMSGKDDVSDAQVLIISYDLLSRHADSLKQQFGFIILDESHFLKSWSTARTQAVKVMVKNARRVLLLSGTPALSRPSELYTQLQCIDPKAFPNLQEFGLRYCAGKKNPWGWDYSGCSNMQELQLLLERRFMIRRLKSNVITQLPAKRRQLVILNPSEISSNSKEMKRSMKKLEKENLKGMERRGALLQYFHTTGTAKLPAIKGYIKDLLEGEKKFICFAHHSVVMKGICETIEQKKIQYIKIDGSTSPTLRKELCDRFQYQEKCMVAVLSITAANTGITLTATQLVVFAELFWNPGILTQAEDRAHRIGQQDSVLVQYLVAQGTADDHLWPLIQNKLNVLNKAGLSKDNFHSSDTILATNTDKSQKTLTNFFDVLNCEDLDELLASALDDTEAKLQDC